MTTAELVKAVKDHASRNYNRDGWDIIVECYTDAELAELIGKAKTAAGAIRKAAGRARAKNEQRDEIRATEW